MSEFILRTRYGNQVWPSALSTPPYVYEWDGNKFWFNVHGMSFVKEIEIEKSMQEDLISSLVLNMSFANPSWDMVPAHLQRKIGFIFDEVRSVAVMIDKCIRQTPKGVRLAPLIFEEEFIDQSNTIPVIYWRYSAEECERLTPLYAHRDSTFKNKFAKGFSIPLPKNFERRQIHFENSEMEEICKKIPVSLDFGPSSSLYSIAFQNFIDGSLDSAVLILATSIETALKWWLSSHGEGVSVYLLDEMQSPALEKLFLCAINNTPLDLPSHFTEWLQDLRVSRNKVAHKSKEIKIENLKIGRWFAVGEAILKAIHGYKSDPWVGCLVEPTSSKAIEDFPPGCLGIVLRREENYGEDCLHVLMDTGVTRRFSEKACRKCSKQKF